MSKQARCSQVDKVDTLYDGTCTELARLSLADTSTKAHVAKNYLQQYKNDPKMRRVGKPSDPPDGSYLIVRSCFSNEYTVVSVHNEACNQP